MPGVCCFAFCGPESFLTVGVRSTVGGLIGGAGIFDGRDIRGVYDANVTEITPEYYVSRQLSTFALHHGAVSAGSLLICHACCCRGLGFGASSTF